MTFSSMQSTMTLLGESPSWSHMSKGLHHNSNLSAMMSLIMIAIVLGVVVALCLGARYAYTYCQENGYRSRWLLFWHLCRAHKLSLSDIQLLRRLASNHNLKEPGQLFIKPDCFDPLALGTRVPADVLRYTQIRDLLFARRLGKTASK